MKTIQWGILGCGGIARKFASSAQVVDSAKVVAVASRSSGAKARAFAEELKETHGDVTAYDSYEALLADDAIDAVYVANTHNFHHHTVLLALQAGKHVLCEKPLTVNARQAMECIDAASDSGLFLMEAMWTRFLPACRQLMTWIEEGRIGQVQQVSAGFGFNGNWPEDGRMLNRDLAGGCMLDMGIYPLSFVSMVAGGQAPVKIQSQSVIGKTGVDIDGTYLLTYPDTITAVCKTSFSVAIDRDAKVIGTKGTLSLPSTFISATEVRLTTEKEDATSCFLCKEDEAFCYEIEHACECIASGVTDSPIMPLAETLTLARTMDTLRDQCGLRYPADET